MVIMDKNCLGDGDPVFDLESGVNSVNKEQQEAKDTVFSAGQDKGVLGRVWNGFVAISRSIKGERSVKLYHSTSNTVELPLTKEEALVDKRLGQEAKVGLSEKKIGVEKTKKKGCKKPPKPPRPPNSPPLDAADQKLMKEIAEVALMKRARIERMKKKMKNAKLTHSNGNFWAFIITILFVIVIIWQGVISRGSSNFSFHGSPESSVRARGGFISIQFYKNASKNVLHASTSASPNNVSG